MNREQLIDALRVIHPTAVVADVGFSGDITITYNGETGEDATVLRWGLEAEQPDEEQLLAALAQWEGGALARRKVEARTIVDKGAEACRIKIGTPIWFQDSLYQMKAEEAARFYLDPTPNKYKFPLLYAESEARGMTLEALCAEYSYNAAMWPLLFGAMEGVRTGAIFGIKDATALEEIEAILAGVVWPL